VNQREQVAAYALGELDGAERDAFEARLAGDHELRLEVESMRATIGVLGDLPAEAWPGATPEVAPGEPAAEPTLRRSAAPRFWRVRPAFAVAALVLVAVLGGVAGALINSGGSSGNGSPSAEIVLHHLDAPNTAGADISMPDAETMLLHAHGLPASAAGQYYEVWLMNDAESLVPVASFRVGPSGSATVEVPLPADPGAYRYFDVSRQTVSGGTVHSGDSVLRGAT
jgi:anti-sigma-K factor RskA